MGMPVQKRIRPTMAKRRRKARTSDLSSLAGGPESFCSPSLSVSVNSSVSFLFGCHFLSTPLEMSPSTSLNHFENSELIGCLDIDLYAAALVKDWLSEWQ